ncbi:MAG: hypothetical protein FWG14_09440 [Peptococcaceae bacterium]|nr:hypothetical protein [Peptococcaceae bacterium]
MDKKKLLSTRLLSLFISVLLAFSLSSCATIGDTVKTFVDNLDPLNSYLNDLARDQNPAEQPRVQISEDFSPISYTHKHGYRSLTPDEKAVYDKIHTASINYHRFLDLRETPVPPNDLFRIFYYYIDDHPESFWLYPQIEKYFHNDKRDLCLGALLRYTDKNDIDQYNEDSDELDTKVSNTKLTQIREEFNKKINELLGLLSPNDDVLSKEIKIYNHIAENVRYDDDLADQVLSGSVKRPIMQSAYGAAIEKSTVCTGFSKLFLLLMNSTGIECMIQHGTLEGVGHVWNIISIDGNYYNVDVTQSTSILNEKRIIDYPFFNTTDQVIQKTHTIKPATLSSSLVQVSYDVPACTSYDKTFDTLFSVKVEGNVFNQQDFSAKIKQLYTYNLSMVYFIFPDGTPKRTVQNFLDTHIHNMKNLCSRYYTMEDYYSYREDTGKAFIKLHRK